MDSIGIKCVYKYTPYALRRKFIRLICFLLNPSLRLIDSRCFFTVVRDIWSLEAIILEVAPVLIKLQISDSLGVSLDDI